MPKLKKLAYIDKNNEEKFIEFFNENIENEDFFGSIITGPNGNHKSTILREIVFSVIQSDLPENATLAGWSKFNYPVIAVSGSIADRFPARESPGGRPTEFSVPLYFYLGQRVGANIFSKKQSLETILAAMLNEKNFDRFSFPFFRRATDFAGIGPNIEFIVQPYTRVEREKPRPTREQILDIAEGRSIRLKEKPLISVPTAKFLIEHFSEIEFENMDAFLASSKHNRFTVRIKQDAKPLPSISLSSSEVRLGILSKKFKVSDVIVYSKKYHKSFSALELSSGEFQMWSTILGIGFHLDNDAFVLIDEPENSLHPAWQKELIECIWRMCANYTRGHLVISTHSPLIVAAAGRNFSLVDLIDGNATPTGRHLFGASADGILFEQFGIASSRNQYVIDIVQRAVSLVENDAYDKILPEETRAELLRLKALLPENDPLILVVNTLLEVER